MEARKKRALNARHSFNKPEPQKTTEGKNKNANDDSMESDGKYLTIRLTSFQEHAKEINEK
jgi:hypothetical protein